MKIHKHLHLSLQLIQILNRIFILTMSNIDGSDFYNIKFQVKPFMLWIWFAAFLTASGGLVRVFLKK